MTKHFMVDIDNVVADTDPVMRRLIQAETGGRVDFRRQDILHYIYQDNRDRAGQSITGEEWNRVHERFCDADIIGIIQPVRDAVESLKRLAEIGRLHLCTARLQKARKPTIDWLDMIGVPPHDIHFTGSHRTNIAFDLAIEDCHHQALAFAKNGTPAILLSYPWNLAGEKHPNLMWATTWATIVEFATFKWPSD